MILADTTDRAALAADIREALTAALHGHELAEGIACRLPADLRAAATPGALHLLTGRKTVIEALIVALYASHRTVDASPLMGADTAP